MRFKLKNDLHRMVFFSSPRVARMSFLRNELSAVHSRDLPTRAMDLFHIAIACETGADEFLTFDEDQANLARTAASPFGKAKMPSTPETKTARLHAPSFWKSNQP